MSFPTLSMMTYRERDAVREASLTSKLWLGYIAAIFVILAHRKTKLDHDDESILQADDETNQRFNTLSSTTVLQEERVLCALQLFK